MVSGRPIPRDWRFLPAVKQGFAFIRALNKFFLLNTHIEDVSAPLAKI